MTSQESQENSSTPSQESSFLFRTPQEFIEAPIQKIERTNDQEVPDTSKMMPSITNFRDTMGTPFIAHHYGLMYNELPKSEQEKIDKVNDFLVMKIKTKGYKDEPETAEVIMNELEKTLRLDQTAKNNYMKIDKMNEFLNVLDNPDISAENEKKIIKKEAKIKENVYKEKVNMLETQVKELPKIQKQVIKAESELLKTQAKSEALQDRLMYAEQMLNDYKQEATDLRSKANLADRYEQEVYQLKNQLQSVQSEVEQAHQYIDQQDRIAKQLEMEAQNSKRMIANMINL